MSCKRVWMKFFFSMEKRKMMELIISSRMLDEISAIELTTHFKCPK